MSPGPRADRARRHAGGSGSPATAAPRAVFGAIAGLALIVSAALWIHRDALRAPFFADDYLFLDQARGGSLAAALAQPDPLGNYFRPLSRKLWFWSMVRAGGESPRVFHAGNLALLAIAILLLFAIARARLGAAAGLAAAAILAVHYSADVPVLWASGSQDLLALVGALAAIALHGAGRRWRWLAALVLFAALLCKETVLLTPVIAMLVEHRPGRSWRSSLRRAGPLGVAVAAWATLWLATIQRRPAFGHEIHVGPAGLPAAVLHLVQVVLGLEWPHDGPAHLLHAPPLVPLALALAGVWVGSWGAGRPATRPAATGTESREALVGNAPDGRVRPLAPGSGIAWALLGALPVAGVAAIWSGYFYLFAIAGVALALAALTAGRPLALRLAIVALVAWGSENAREVGEFATARGPWTAQSHLNRFYLERGMRTATRYLGDLRRLMPDVPPRSTLYFAGLPASIGFQAADGPLLRWAYGDSSLRSYFLTQFSLEQARRGPVFFFMVARDTLQELKGTHALEEIGLAHIVSEAPASARDILTLAIERDPRGGSVPDWYRRAWAEWALDDTAGAGRSLARIGIVPATGSAPEVEQALRAVAAGDTAGAIRLATGTVFRHVVDPGPHALLSDLLLARNPLSEDGAIEAYAARLLAPEVPRMWRRWGMVQAIWGRDDQAEGSLQRYFELGGAEALADTLAQNVYAELQRRLPGGAEAQQELRRTAGAR